MGQPHAARMALPRAGGAPCPPQASAGLQSGGSPRSELRAPSLSPSPALGGGAPAGVGGYEPLRLGRIEWMVGRPPSSP